MSSITSATDTTSTSSSASSSLSASYEVFLQLLCTQLENQNPLDPMDATEFTNQLVLYSTLEQQINTNDKLDTLLSSLDSFNSSSAVAYIGKTVEVEEDTRAVTEGEGASWVYDLDAEAEEVTLTITDEDGNTVWTGTGETAAGDHTLEWDGLDEDGEAVPSGDYTLTVTATNSSGDSVDVTIRIQGVVSGVDTSDDSTALELEDGTEVDLDDVTRIAA